MLFKVQRFYNQLADNRKTLVILLIALPLILSLQSYLVSINQPESERKHYNTYQIFKSAHEHLFSDQDLYSPHTEEHVYTYKYSPTFALGFGVFANLPDAVGLSLWLLLSGVITLLALRTLPGLDTRKQLLFFLVICLEWITSTQGQQTNVLVVMLLLIALASLEKDRPLLASFAIVSTLFIKVFGIGAVLLYLFYPKKLKLGLYTSLWIVLFAAAPLLVHDLDATLGIYSDWFGQIAGDHQQYSGMSVFGAITNWFGTEPPKIILLALAGLVLVSPMAQITKWKSLQFRLMMLASMLIWFVIFNHKAESPSYIIAMTGIALWFFVRRRGTADTALLWFAILMLSVLFTDLVPRPWRDFAFDHHLKVIPAFVIWVRVTLDLWGVGDEGYTLADSR